MKQGELEAKQILEKFGVSFDEAYFDTNCGYSEADLKICDGHFVEVTHTWHNNKLFNDVNKFWQLPIDEQLRKSQEVADALHRVQELNYEQTERGFTEEGKKQYKKDRQLIKEHMGVDITPEGEQYSEFNCDVPLIHFDVDKIIRELSFDKGKKYPDGNVDLFIFVAEEEYNSLVKVLGECKWNGYSSQCINSIINSPFPNIYVCEWDIHRQKYELDNPRILKLEKISKDKKKGIQVLVM